MTDRDLGTLGRYSTGVSESRSFSAPTGHDTLELGNQIGVLECMISEPNLRMPSCPTTARTGGVNKHTRYQEQVNMGSIYQDQLGLRLDIRHRAPSSHAALRLAFTASSLWSIIAMVRNLGMGWVGCIGEVWSSHLGKKSLGNGWA